MRDKEYRQRQELAKQQAVRDQHSAKQNSQMMGLMARTIDKLSSAPAEPPSAAPAPKLDAHEIAGMPREVFEIVEKQRL